jgi:acetyl esterase/lipase
MRTQMSRLLFFVFISTVTAGYGQRTIPLYNGEISNIIKGSVIDISKPDGRAWQRVSTPTLSIYLPEGVQEKRTAVIICAGGGYAEVNIKREGYDVAEAFNKAGVAAIVLKYRLPDDRTNKNKTVAPLQDAQKAIKMVRDSAAVWHINPAKIGIMGFSAGGHLASSAGTHYNTVTIPNTSKTNLRPDFMILVYPVISFNDAFGHTGSRNNLIGTAPSADSIAFFSNELHVNKKTPQTFIVHAGDDKVVPVANSVRFYEELNKNGVAADLHIYSKGGHGFAVTPAFEEWFQRCLHWMKSNQWMSEVKER